MNPGSLSQDETDDIRCQQLRMRLAQEAHLQARQRLDLRRDLAAKLLPSHGPLEVNEAVWYWARGMSKIRGGHFWLRAKKSCRLNMAVLWSKYSYRTVHLTM